MGTLSNQLPHNYYEVFEENLESYLERVQFLAVKYNMSPDTIISAARVLELRRSTNIQVEAGDYLDENLGGFGDILRDILDILSHMK